MPELADFQIAFAAAMSRPGRSGSLERQPGFDVYRNTSPAALIDVLSSAYPVTLSILGEEAFAYAAFGFVRAAPPRDPLLVGYGARFDEFLASLPFAVDLPYLRDVASIERLRTEAHIAADSPTLDFRDLARIGEGGWAGLRLPLHPATGFAWLTTPAVTIWRAHIDGFETLEPEWRAEGVLVTRTPGGIEVEAISAPDHRMLSEFRLRENVGRAAAAAAALYPAADLAGIFAKLVNSGAFARPPFLERN